MIMTIDIIISNIIWIIKNILLDFKPKIIYQYFKLDTKFYSEYNFHQIRMIWNDND